jgi:hypothetical protein
MTMYAAHAPDFVEPALGWRAWAVVDRDLEPRLRSIYYDVVWQPGRALVAACLHRPRAIRLPWRTRMREHETPEVECTCGIYAAADPLTAAAYLDAPISSAERCRVLGIVSLWGHVVECDRGWRASHAYPHRLYVPRLASRAGWSRRSAPLDDLPFELARYGVPVEELDVATADGVVAALARS